MMYGHWYGPRDWFIRLGEHGPGLSIQPANHWVPFTERMGLRPAWHVFGICIKPFKSRPRP